MILYFLGVVTLKSLMIVKKCCLYGLNVEVERRNNFVFYFGMQGGGSPFFLFRVKIGYAHRKVSNWDYVMELLEDIHWKRLTLINYVLSSLPVYLLSTFSVPKLIVHEIVRLQRTFLCGGGSAMLSLGSGCGGFILREIVFGLDLLSLSGVWLGESG
ncbi:hypothetical protein ACS0TY_027577 [Phlomoides rotata]